MELLRRKCPECRSADIQYHSPYTTKNHGGRVIYKCEHCPVYFSETKNTPTTTLSCVDQICTRRIAVFRLDATRESDLLHIRKSLY